MIFDNHNNFSYYVTGGLVLTLALFFLFLGTD